jgi:hypothetical protein
MDLLTFAFFDEPVVVVVWQICAHQDRVIVGYRELASIHGPVVPPAQTDTIPEVVAAILPFRVYVGTLHFGLTFRGPQLASADGASVAVQLLPDVPPPKTGRAAGGGSGHPTRGRKSVRAAGVARRG